MIKKILIANRGEIAVRIIRACRDMGIISVAVYSSADKDALHKFIADESVCIGPAMAKDSYLDMKKIISAALAYKADAIHPGYGFLSENAEFAKMCRDNGIEFIGPSPEAINLLGDKMQAKKTMISANVPVVPGSDGEISDLAHAKKIAEKIGYPVMIKASSGGGGRGIRFVKSESELERNLDSARAEAKANFGDERMYMEKCIINPRHIELQVLGDKHGNVVHLFERDCSLQRRHQKVIEESPSPFVDDELRREMGAAAVRAAKAANYYSAGTIEFLVDSDKNYYFMEMNTRIQVEHPVTEYVTGIDLIKSQIEVANGKELEFRQEDIVLKGNAIECRVNAEDPSRDFAPCPGKIEDLYIPGGLGVRIDSSIYQDYSIPPFYDSLIGKIIVYGNGRSEAMARMKRALSEFICTGIITNRDYLLDLLNDKNIENGEYNIDYLDKITKKTKKIKKDR